MSKGRAASRAANRAAIYEENERLKRELAEARQALRDAEIRHADAVRVELAERNQTIAALVDEQVKGYIAKSSSVDREIVETAHGARVRREVLMDTWEMYKRGDVSFTQHGWLDFCEKLGYPKLAGQLLHQYAGRTSREFRRENTRQKLNMRDSELSKHAKQALGLSKKEGAPNEETA